MGNAAARSSDSSVETHRLPARRLQARGAQGPEVHITVATMPRGDISGSLAHDAALVKAALLYADRVTLASPNAIMLAGVAGLTVPDRKTDATR